MTVETVLRCGLSKQYRELTYEGAGVLATGLEFVPSVREIGEGGVCEEVDVTQEHQCGGLGDVGAALMGV